MATCPIFLLILKHITQQLTVHTWSQRSNESQNTLWESQVFCCMVSVVCRLVSQLSKKLQKKQMHDHKGKKNWERLQTPSHSLYCTVKDSLMIHTIKKPGFQRLVKMHDCRYEIHSQSYFSKMVIPSMHAYMHRWQGNGRALVSCNNLFCQYHMIFGLAME